MPYINGFSVNRSPSRIGVRNYTVPGTTVALPVRAEIAPLLIGLAREFHLIVEPLVKGWCWGYAYREVTGGSSYSFHAAGIAIDLNAPRHPYGRRNTFSAADQQRCRALARKYGCRWGGDYTRTKDDMHFEVILGRTQALELVRRLQRAPVAPTGHSHAMPLVRSGSRGAAVSDVQGHINAWRRNRNLALMRKDGDFGPSTKYCVEVFQQAYGYSRDGIVGPNTWRLIHNITKGASI